MTRKFVGYDYKYKVLKMNKKKTYLKMSSFATFCTHLCLFMFNALFVLNKIFLISKQLILKTKNIQLFFHRANCKHGWKVIGRLNKMNTKQNADLKELMENVIWGPIWHTASKHGCNVPQGNMRWCWKCGKCTIN